MRCCECLHWVWLLPAVLSAPIRSLWDGVGRLESGGPHSAHTARAAFLFF